MARVSEYIRTGTGRSATPLIARQSHTTAYSGNVQRRIQTRSRQESVREE